MTTICVVFVRHGTRIKLISIRPAYRQTVDKGSMHQRCFDACQMAIEDKLIELIGQASDAGWHRDEILSAVIVIADDLALARREDIALAIETQLLNLMKRKDV